MVKNIKIDNKEHEYVNLKKKYIESLKVIKILITFNKLVYFFFLNLYIHYLFFELLVFFDKCSLLIVNLIFYHLISLNI